MDMPCGIRNQDGGVARSFAWKPLTGALEAEAAEAAQLPTRPEAIAGVLAATLARIGSDAVDVDMVLKLPAGDARFLMSRLARHFGRDQRWITAHCAQCKTPFDFMIALGDLPAQQAATYAPAWVEVETGVGVIRARLPTCADQIEVARQGATDGAAALLSLIVSRPPDDLDDDDLRRVDTALSELSPSIPYGASAACPGCGYVNELPVSPSDWLAELGEGPVHDVHAIASAYGWSEADILALSRVMREAYLRLIDRSRGVSGAEA